MVGGQGRQGPSPGAAMERVVGNSLPAAARRRLGAGEGLTVERQDEAGNLRRHAAAHRSVPRLVAAAAAIPSSKRRAGQRLMRSVMTAS